MQPLTPAEATTCRLLAASWDPASLPRPDEIDWPAVLAELAPSNIVAALYPLSEPLRATIPAEVQSRLEQTYYRAAAAYLRNMQQLVQVGQTLSGQDAPHLLLKGAAMALSLYAEPAVRLMGDIDLAIPREYEPACRAALLAQGYQLERAEHQPGSFLLHKNQEAFIPADPRALVELHWHILDAQYYMRHIPMAWFWGQTESLEVDGHIFQVLNAEANLVYLPAHLALHHNLKNWHSLLDLALIVMKNRDRLDWEKIVAAAADFDLLTCLQATLERLALCWPELPLAEARRLAGARQPSANDARFFRLLTAENRSHTLDFYIALVSLPNLRLRARYALAQIFPQPAYMYARYQFTGAWQLPYRYLARLAGGVWRFLAMLPRARRIANSGG